MNICFVFGTEPSLLPPAIEMMKAMKNNGASISTFFLEYKGNLQNEVLPSNHVVSIPKPGGIRKITAPFSLGKKIKEHILANTTDIIIICDIISLQTINTIRIPKGTILVYWGFEIIKTKQPFKLSLDFYRSRLIKRWLKRIDFVLAPSESRLNHMFSLFNNPIKGQVILNCRSQCKDYGIENFSIPFNLNSSNITKLSYTGRITPTHHIDEIIDSMNYLPDNTILLIAGIIDENFKSNFFDRIKKNKAAHQIFYLGHLSRNQAYYLNSISDIGFVFYKYGLTAETNDPAPNKIGDYFAEGVIPIATAHEYHKSWLTNKETGICIEKVTGENIAKAVSNLIREKEVMTGYKDKIQAVFESEYNMEKQYEKFIDLLKITK